MRVTARHSRFRPTPQRANRVLISSGNKNLGGNNWLTLGSGLIDRPQNLIAIATQSATLNQWDISVSWGVPPDVTPTGYTVEYEQIDDPVTPFGATQTVTGLTVAINGLPEGAYRFRVRTEYPAGPSNWVTSSIVMAFINQSFNAQNSPQFHTMAFF